MIFNAYETLYYLFQFLIFMENPKLLENQFIYPNPPAGGAGVNEENQ